MKRFQDSATEEKLTKLSDDLSISVQTLRQFGVGLSNPDLQFAFPVHGENGQVCGVLIYNPEQPMLSRRPRVRHEELTDKSTPGVLLGAFNTSLAKRVYVVEGIRDAAALNDMGLMALGHLGCHEGVKPLAHVLNDVPIDCDIVVIGSEPREIEDGDERRPYYNVEYQQQKGIRRIPMPELCKALANHLGKPVKQAFLQANYLSVLQFFKGRDVRDRSPTDRGKILENYLQQVATTVQPENAHRFRLHNYTDFMVETNVPNWLVEMLFLEKQVTVIGGPKKALKTSIALDLAYSLATGLPFLNHFPVRRPQRVAFFSGETSEAAAQDILRRIQRSRKRLQRQGETIPLMLSLNLPQLNSSEDLITLGHVIRRNQISAVFFDPLYLALSNGDASVDTSNLFHVGPILRKVSEVCLNEGATPFFIHHTRKESGRGATRNSLPSRWDDLDVLAYAGIAEIARQWMLLTRRTPFDTATGLHKLNLAVGGASIGGKLYGLEVSEGVQNLDLNGREWMPSVKSAAELKAENLAQRASKKSQQGISADEYQRILDVLKQGSATVSDISDKAAMGKPKVKEALEQLIGQGKVAECQVRRGNKPCQGYQMVAG